MKIGFTKYIEERIFQAVCPDRAAKYTELFTNIQFQTIQLT